MRRIICPGSGSLLAKLDIESAYCLVPIHVHPRDRLLLGAAPFSGQWAVTGQRHVCFFAFLRVRGRDDRPADNGLHVLSSQSLQALSCIDNLFAGCLGGGTVAWPMVWTGRAAWGVGLWPSWAGWNLMSQTGDMAGCIRRHECSHDDAACVIYISNDRICFCSSDLASQLSAPPPRHALGP